MPYGCILYNAGYDVVPCGTVNHFNEVVGHRLPDMFILDILLPDGNGLDNCRQLRKNEQTAGVPVLIMSAHQAKQDVEAKVC
ncbi:response regulator [Mucilaginibacter rubeus]|uniref:response regulator n=1 Tax=Mucilaginibacter rubeus TaxID=2027860 RepID=UPI0033965837